jgi:hypothetical protein
MLEMSLPKGHRQGQGTGSPFYQLPFTITYIPSLLDQSIQSSFSFPSVTGTTPSIP